MLEVGTKIMDISEERKEKWGRLSDEVIAKLQAAGYERIPEDWGRLSTSLVDRLKELGFKGILEFSDCSTLMLEAELKAQSGVGEVIAVRICDSIDSALKREIQRLGLDIPGLAWPTMENLRQGKVVITREEVLAIADKAGIGLEDEDVTDEYLKKFSAQLEGEVKDLLGVPTGSQGEPRGGVSQITIASPVGENDELEQLEDEKFLELVAKPSKSAGYGRSEAKKEEPLSFLSGLSRYVRQLLMSITAVAFVATAEQFFDCLKTKEVLEQVDRVLKGRARGGFDDFCEKNFGERPLGTNLWMGTKKKKVTLQVAEPAALTLAAEPATAADSLSRIGDALLRLEAALDRHTAALTASFRTSRTPQEEIILNITRSLMDEFGWEEAISHLERMVDLLVGVSERKRRQK